MGDTIVTTVMSNLGLYKACDKIGMKYEKTAVGDKYVYENMCKNNFSLGGEQSGHIIFSKHATTGDGILTFTYDHGSNSGEENEPFQIGRACKDLSTASSECPCGR